MRLLLSFHSALLMLMLFYPNPSYDINRLTYYLDDELAALQQRYPRFRAILGRDETRPGPSKETMGRESEYRPAREIKRFTEPTILLRGTAEEIGLGEPYTRIAFLK